MKIPGLTTVFPSVVRILVITTALCTTSITSYRVGVISGESTSGRYESLEVKLGGSAVKVTGKSTTEVVKSLLGTSKGLEGIPFGGLY